MAEIRRANFANLSERRITRLWFGLGALGVALIIMGMRELKINSVADVEPQRITCAELAANGPGKNAHVIVSDFLMCDAWVYKENFPGSWDRAWVPIVPLDGEYVRMLKKLADENGGEIEGDVPLPTDIRVIVEFPDVKNAEDVARFGEQDQLQGTIVNVVKKKLQKETRKLLEESYHVSMDRCWILLEGHIPGSTSRLWNYFGGGAILIVFGGFMMLRIAYSG